MTVEHTMPSSVLPMLGSSYGVTRPGQVLTKFDSGPVMSRDWFEYNLRRYDLELAPLDSGGTAVAEFEQFLEHVDGGGSAFYFKEPSSATHRAVLCGGITDASATTFPLPVRSASDVTVFVGGAVQGAGYTVHEASNLLSDNMAAFETSTTGWDAWGSSTISRVSGLAADGLSCAKVDPTGTVASVGIKTNASYRIAVDASQEYTVVASVRGSGTFKIGWLCYTSAPAAIGSRQWSAGDSGTTSGWTQISYTDTTDATAATLEVAVERTSSSANDFYIDCVGVVPGDLARWHLPSVCPGAIEFGAAPAAGGRVTATATGYRLARVRFSGGSLAWTWRGPGYAYPRRVTLVEDIEV